MAFPSTPVFPLPAPSAGASVKVMNRLAKCLIVAGLLYAGARLSAAPTAVERAAQPANEQGGEMRPARPAPGLRHARPETRLATGASAVSWSGAL